MTQNVESTDIILFTPPHYTEFHEIDNREVTLREHALSSYIKFNFKLNNMYKTPLRIQQHYVNISYTDFRPSRSRTVHSASINSYTPLSEV